MLLQIKDLEVSYGGVRALQGVSVDMEKGEILSILGANGAGKTTLANTICGFVKPNKGDIFYKEKRINMYPPHAVVALGIAQIPEGRGIFGTLTVLENLKTGAYLNPSNTAIEKDLEHIYELFPVLRERSKQRGSSLSGGEQQMLAIGRGLMSHPDLLIMDEPTLGLSPVLRKEVANIIKEINSSGTSIILVEQDARMALGLSHKGVVLQNGEVTIKGPSRELLNNAMLQESYL